MVNFIRGPKIDPSAIGAFLSSITLTLYRWTFSFLAYLLRNWYIKKGCFPRDSNPGPPASQTHDLPWQRFRTYMRPTTMTYLHLEQFFSAVVWLLYGLVALGLINKIRFSKAKRGSCAQGTAKSTFDAVCSQFSATVSVLGLNGIIPLFKSYIVL